MVHMKKIIEINLEKKRLELGLTGGGEDALRRYLWRGGLGIEHSTLVGSGETLMICMNEMETRVGVWDWETQTQESTQQSDLTLNALRKLHLLSSLRFV